MVYNVLLDYNKYSTFLSLVNDNVKILDTIFDNVVSIKFALSEDYNEIFTNKINDTFCGEVNLKIISKGFNPF